MKRILIISLAFLLFCCKIKKQTTTETQAVTIEQKEVFTKMNESKSDNSVIEIDENQHVTIMVFSPPDSLGKQYVTSVMEIQKKKKYKGKKIK